MVLWVMKYLWEAPADPAIDKCPTCASSSVANLGPVRNPPEDSVGIPAGFLYVLTNPKMPGLLKIGCTTRSVEERVQELNAATGVPSPFVVEAVSPSDTPLEDEARVHEWLQKSRLVGREFFETDLREAVAAIQSVVGHKASFTRFQDSNISVLNFVQRWSCGLCKYVWNAAPESRFEKCPQCSGITIVRLAHARGPLAHGA
jgi:hypothetical protein